MEKVVYVIDARSRERELVTASATRLPNNAFALVLRKGVDVGSVEALCGQAVKHPILIIGSYQARSSAGFVTPVGAGVYNSVIWVGGAGFGFTDEDGRRKGDALRPFGRPLKAALVNAGARVEKVQTPFTSNPATAEAAFEGLRLRALAQRRLTFLVEGQSDYITATSFEEPEGAESDFPAEHREDIFSCENMFKAAMRRIARRDEGRQALYTAILRAAYQAGKKAAFIGGMPAEIIEVLGDEEMQRIAEEQSAAYEAVGWKFGYDMSVGNHFTRVISPNGEITNGPALFGAGKVEDIFLELATFNSEEEKREMRISNFSARLVQFFWYGWVIGKPGVGLTNMYDHDMLVRAEFSDGSDQKLWFGRIKPEGPNGEPSQGSRFLSAFDAKGFHLWDRLLEVKRLTITAYGRDGQAVESRVWESGKDPGCGGGGASYMAVCP